MTRILSEQLIWYAKKRKLRTALFVIAISLVALAMLIWPEFDESVVQKVQPKVLWMALLASIGIIVILYSYIRYVHQEILLNENNNQTGDSYETVTEGDFNRLISSIENAQFSLMNSLLVFNGIVASIFIALILTQTGNQVLAIILFVFFLAASSPLIFTFLTILRTNTSMLFAINSPKEKIEQDNYQAALIRIGIRNRQNIYLSIAFTVAQFLFILTLLFFAF